MHTDELITKVMSVSEWISVATNPRQRDTDRHAEKALSAHLSSYSPTQRFVSAALLPNGTLIKLDGHTRALLWATGKLKRPNDDCVMVAIYRVKNIDGALELYDTFDNFKAAETSSDRIYGQLRELGIQDTHSKLLDFGICAAKEMIEGHKMARRLGQGDVGRFVSEWSVELMILLEIGEGKQRRMTSPLVAAFLVTTRLYGDRAVEFWTKYIDDSGTKTETTTDAVEQLSRVVSSAKAARMTLGWKNMITLAGRACSCVIAYLEQRDFKLTGGGGAKPSDFRALSIKATSKQ